MMNPVLTRVGSLLVAVAVLCLVSCSKPVPTERAPQVPVEPVEMSIHRIDTSADEARATAGDRPIHVGDVVSVNGTVIAADAPNRPVLVSFIMKSRQGKEVAHNEALGSWKEGAAADEWIYEHELEAPRQPGTYTLVVRHGDAIIDEQTIEVVK